MPERIQLSRRKGFRLPPDTISVARPTKYGNPWRVGTCGCRSVGDCPHTFVVPTAADAVEAFRAWREGIAAANAERAEKYLAPLRGSNLACWCKPGEPCHAEVLLDLANK